jgi:hypothetical protein
MSADRARLKRAVDIRIGDRIVDGDNPLPTVGGGPVSIDGAVTIDGPIALKGSITAGSVAIANGASLSGTIDLSAGERQLTGIQMPAAWTAASLTFAVSHDGVTFVPLYWDGAEYAIAAAGGAAASLGVSLEPSAFAGWPFVRIRSGTAAAAVNQAAERTLAVLTRAV